MPHVLVTGLLGKSDVNVYGLSRRELEEAKRNLTPFGGKISQDGQMFVEAPIEVIDYLQISFHYSVVSCVVYGDNQKIMWTLHRPIITKNQNYS